MSRQPQTPWRATEAENGEEALAAIAKQRPDLILMDIQLPIIDGYEATRRIKADAALRSIPIIAVTVLCAQRRRTEGASGRWESRRKKRVIECPTGAFRSNYDLFAGDPIAQPSSTKNKGHSKDTRKDNE